VEGLHGAVTQAKAEADAQAGALERAEGRRDGAEQELEDLQKQLSAQQVSLMEQGA